MGFLSVLGMAQRLVKERLTAGCAVIDATCGNGVDTQFMVELVGPRGTVYVFDIQAAALERTQQRIATAYEQSGGSGRAQDTGARGRSACACQPRRDGQTCTSSAPRRGNGCHVQSRLFAGSGYVRHYRRLHAFRAGELPVAAAAGRHHHHRTLSRPSRRAAGSRSRNELGVGSFPGKGTNPAVPNGTETTAPFLIAVEKK